MALKLVWWSDFQWIIFADKFSKTLCQKFKLRSLIRNINILIKSLTVICREVRIKLIMRIVMQSHLLPYRKNSFIIFSICKFYFSGSINFYLFGVIIIFFPKFTFFYIWIQKYPLRLIQNDAFIMLFWLTCRIITLGFNWTYISLSFWRCWRIYIITFCFGTPWIDFGVFSKKNVFSEDFAWLIIFYNASYYFAPLFVIVYIILVARIDTRDGYLGNIKLLLICERFAFHYILININTN